MRDLENAKKKPRPILPHLDHSFEYESRGMNAINISMQLQDYRSDVDTPIGSEADMPMTTKRGILAEMRRQISGTSSLESGSSKGSPRGSPKEGWGNMGEGDMRTDNQFKPHQEDVPWPSPDPIKGTPTHAQMIHVQPAHHKEDSEESSLALVGDSEEEEHKMGDLHMQ